jgi:hypothetical protein
MVQPTDYRQMLLDTIANALTSDPNPLTGDKVPRELAASGIEHRNRAENRAVYGA